MSIRFDIPDKNRQAQDEVFSSQFFAILRKLKKIQSSSEVVTDRKTGG